MNTSNCIPLICLWTQFDICFSARITPVKFMFQHKGHVLVDLGKTCNQIVPEELVDIALAAGADDFDTIQSGNNGCTLRASRPNRTVCGTVH